MRLFIRDNYIDLGDPVFMTDNQREKLIKFMKENFGEVKVVNVTEMARPGPSGGEQRKWSVDDLSLLFHGGTVEEKAAKLSRSAMSIIMRTGSIVPEITKWMKEKGYKKFPPPREIIEEFIGEKEII